MDALCFLAGTWDQRRHIDRNLCLQIKLTNLSTQRSLFTRWTGWKSLYNLFICSLTRPSHSHARLCHREGEEVDLWPKEGSLRRLFKSSAPPRRGLSKTVVTDVSITSVLWRTPEQETGYRCAFKPRGCWEIYGIFVILQGQTGGEHRSRSGEGQRRRQGAEGASRKCLFLWLSTFQMVIFPRRPSIMPGRRNGAPMKWNSSTSSAKGASLSSNRVGPVEQTVACVDLLWPMFSLHAQRLWNTRALVGKLCRRALRVRCRGSWSRCCSPSVSQKIQEISDRQKNNWKICLTEPTQEFYLTSATFFQSNVWTVFLPTLQNSCIKAWRWICSLAGYQDPLKQ